MRCYDIFANNIRERIPVSLDPPCIIVGKDCVPIEEQDLGQIVQRGPVFSDRPYEQKWTREEVLVNLRTGEESYIENVEVSESGLIVAPGETKSDKILLLWTITGPEQGIWTISSSEGVNVIAKGVSWHRSWEFVQCLAILELGQSLLGIFMNRGADKSITYLGNGQFERDSYRRRLR